MSKALTELALLAVVAHTASKQASNQSIPQQAMAVNMRTTWSINFR